MVGQNRLNTYVHLSLCVPLKGTETMNDLVKAANGIECSGEKESSKRYFHYLPILSINPTYLPMQSSVQRFSG